MVVLAGPQDTSKMPEAAPFEAMSEAEVDKVLDEAVVEDGAQVTPPAPAKPAEATPAPAATPAKPPAVASTPPASTPTAEDMPEWAKKLQKDNETMRRESGRVRQLQAEIARIKAEGAAPKVQLTPEQQEAEATLNSHLERFIQQKYGTLIQGLQQQEQNAAFYSEVRGILKDWEAPEADLQPIITQMVDEKTKAFEAGDEAASRFLDRMLAPGGSAYLAAEAMRVYSKNLQAKGQSFQAGKAASAAQAAATVTAGGKPPVAAGKAPDEMTQRDFDKMPEDKLDEWLKENGGTGY